MRGLVIQVVSPTYEQVDNGGRIALLNGKKAFVAHVCSAGFYGGVGRPSGVLKVLICFIGGPVES